MEQIPVLKDRVSFTNVGNLVRCATWDPPETIDESYNVGLVTLIAFKSNYWLDFPEFISGAVPC